MFFPFGVSRNNRMRDAERLVLEKVLVLGVVLLVSWLEFFHEILEIIFHEF
jgi:hypothetical protein